VLIELIDIKVSMVENVKYRIKKNNGRRYYYFKRELYIPIEGRNDHTWVSDKS